MHYLSRTSMEGSGWKKERKRQRKCVCVNNEKQRDSNYANEASSWNWSLVALMTTLQMGGINKMLSYWLSRVNISISVWMDIRGYNEVTHSCGAQWIMLRSAKAPQHLYFEMPVFLQASHLEKCFYLCIQPHPFVNIWISFAFLLSLRDWCTLHLTHKIKLYKTHIFLICKKT